MPSAFHGLGDHWCHGDSMPIAFHGLGDHWRNGGKMPIAFHGLGDHWHSGGCRPIAWLRALVTTGTTVALTGCLLVTASYPISSSIVLFEKRLPFLV